MSSLLEQAIVDAKALKEAALKNAEATIIDKYSEEVKSTLGRLLEQDDLSGLEDMMGGDEEPSLEAEDTMQEEVDADEIAEGVPDAFTEDVAEFGDTAEGELTEVTIDFAELAEALKSLREDVEGEDTLEEVDCLDDEEPTAIVEEEDVDEEIELDEDTIMEMVAKMLSDDPAAEEEADSDAMEKTGLEEAEEEGDLYEEITDGLIDALAEELTVDMGASLSGWAGRSSEDTKHQMELELAKRRSTDMKEELDALKQAQEELVFENKKLKETLANYKSVVGSLKENVQDVNLSNARLLYTNRVLGNTSLNERQKQRIVEAISKAGSVEEAKTIHETLQSTVQAGPRISPKSLNEAISRPSSIIRASRKEEPQVDPFSVRMRKLAGIN
jgi:FtsZ-binding cell division protein ZapB